MRFARPLSLTVLGVGLFVGLASAQPAPQTIDASVKPPARMRVGPGKVRPNTYGTDRETYVRIDASQLSPLTSGNLYSGVNNFQLRYSTSVTGLAFIAPVMLPGGALISFIEIDFYDASPTGQVQAALGVCDYAGEACAYQPGLAGCPVTICSDVAYQDGYGASQADLSSNGITVDNFFNRYIIAAGNTTTDGTTAISQIIIGYYLRVSDPPPSPTFNDVPMTDFGFQYIEALSSSGITGGTGGGNFSPDAFVTRRQMAIFLAKALGLQFH